MGRHRRSGRGRSGGFRGIIDVVELSAFEEAAAILASLMPDELGEIRLRARRYGMKVWFGPAQPPRAHYEAQIIGHESVPEATVLALEVGFHAEHRDQADNDAEIAPLLAGERRWRKVLGQEPVAGPFLGTAGPWRRISETWPDPDLGDAELAFEIAARLTDYVTALEPLRKGR